MDDPPPEYPGLDAAPTAPPQDPDQLENERKNENVITNQNQVRSINGDTSYLPPIHVPSHHPNNTNWYCCFCISCGDSSDYHPDHHRNHCCSSTNCNGCCDGWDCDDCCNCCCCDSNGDDCQCCEDCDCGDCDCGDCDCGGCDC